MLLNYKDLRQTYSVCPYCNTNNYDTWIHCCGTNISVACKTCWSSDFGSIFSFATSNNELSDEAPFRLLRVWNGVYETWFRVEDQTIGSNHFGVLIMDQGPVSDNPVEPRLKKKFKIKKSMLPKLLNKRYILNWFNRHTK